MKGTFFLLLYITVCLWGNQSMVGQIRVLSPDGGEEYTLGDVVPILWSGTTSTDTVSIELSADGGVSWSELAAKQTTNRYLWRITESVKPGSSYLIRVVGSSSNKSLFGQQQQLTGGDFSWAEFNDAGTVLAASDRNNRIVLWDTRSWEELKAIVVPENLVLLQVQFSPDGTMLVSGALDGTAQIWNLNTGSIESQIASPTSSIAVVGYSPDGRTIVVGNDEVDGDITLWDVTEKRKRSTYQIHSEGIRYVEYARDGKTILTCSVDGTAKLVDATTGNVLQVFPHATPGTSPVVNGIALSSDGQTVVTCGFDGWVKYWNAITGTLIQSREYHGGQKVSKVHYSPSGKWLSSVGYDGKALLIDPTTGEIIFRADVGVGEAYTTRFNSDETLWSISHGSYGVSIWSIQPNEDTSDSFWSIRECNATSDVTTDNQQLNSTLTIE
ncbi:MAG: WD40 repeat domain-containing protein [Ignavibacteriae bacterium]|nr:WD40 repeat domain-containing protein [Ignavibacteriota bacterium]MCB9217794.1 WD40 repeat domain-containing protein [Ignavibacteria bacterium]